MPMTATGVGHVASSVGMWLAAVLRGGGANTAATTKCGTRRASHQQTPPPPSLYKVPTYSTRKGAAPRAPGGARHGGGNRAVPSQPRTGQSTLYGDVKSSYRGGGGRQVGKEGVRDRGTQERQQTVGGATQTHRTREPQGQG